MKDWRRKIKLYSLKQTAIALIKMTGSLSVCFVSVFLYGYWIYQRKKKAEATSADFFLYG
jgi:hypothetical protein